MRVLISRSYSTITSPLRAANRCCLVTGATSGIGYEITKRLALEGATHIRILSRNVVRGQNAIDQIIHETGKSEIRTSVVEYDAESSKLPSTQQILNASVTWPHVDTMVLCHGITQTQSMFGTSMEQVSNLIQTNQSSFIQLSTEFSKYHQRYCFDLMRQDMKNNKKHAENNKHDIELSTSPQSFSLVSVSSLLAIKGKPGTAVYAATKAAILAFNRSLSLETGQVYQKCAKVGAPPFRVNTVLPGYIDTPMTTGMHKAGSTTLEQTVPLGHFGRPEDVADAVLFLIGNEYANNCTLNLDGGLSAT